MPTLKRQRVKLAKRLRKVNPNLKFIDSLKLSKVISQSEGRYDVKFEKIGFYTEAKNDSEALSPNFAETIGTWLIGESNYEEIVFDMEQIKALYNEYFISPFKDKKTDENEIKRNITGENEI